MDKHLSCLANKEVIICVCISQSSGLQCCISLIQAWVKLDYNYDQTGCQ